MALRSGLLGVNGADLAYELAGVGRPLVFLHGHLIDMCQWDDQMTTFAATNRVLRYDARGYGRSSLPPGPFAHHEDLGDLLDALELSRAVLVGCSGGGMISLDFALTYPDRVDGLVLVSSGLNGFRPSHLISPEMQTMNEARRAGDLETALTAALHAFTDGPRRTPEQVDPRARERTRLMTVRLFARPPVPDAAPQPLDPPTATRLGEIRPPTLVVIGAEDQPAIHAIADRLCADIPHARKIVIPDAGHHPNLEQPGLFDQLLRQFVGGIAAV